VPHVEVNLHVEEGALAHLMSLIEDRLSILFQQYYHRGLPENWSLPEIVSRVVEGGEEDISFLSQVYKDISKRNLFLSFFQNLSNSVPMVNSKP
jgi:hypothetical protein